MKLSEIIKKVNVLIDDELPPEMIEGWVNDAIAQINIDLNANFPSLSLAEDDEPIIPEKWQRALIIVFAAARAKQQDSSQFEYNDLYTQFIGNMEEFKMKYTVPDKYLDSDSKNNSSATPNYSFNYWSNGNGWL